jgi:tetratricopeptide (TPR) repeat protein
LPARSNIDKNKKPEHSSGLDGLTGKIFIEKSFYIKYNLLYLLHDNHGRIDLVIGKKNDFLRYVNIVPVIVLIFLLVCMLFLGVGCKSKQQSSQAETTQNTQLPETPESVTEQSSAPTVSETTTEEIPENIKSIIDQADSYYNSGDYGMAKTFYRKAELAIGDSTLKEETAQSLIDSFSEKYAKSKDIIETARIHYGNAMQLQYETNYEEALKEFEAALDIYPKYAEAQEAYDNLKALMGLS